MKLSLRKKLPLLVGLLLTCLALAAAALFLARWVWLSDGVQSRLPAWRAFVSSWITTPTSGGMPGQSPTGPTLPTKPPLVISTRVTSEESQSRRYTIKASWPYLEWEGDPRIEPFNLMVEALVENEIQSFKDGIAGLPDDPALAEFSSSLQITYSITNSEYGVLSVLMHISFYSAGAAHPGSYSHTINYNLYEGKQITLQDLFAPGINYLAPIADHCLHDLRNREVLGWEDGALPKSENYQNWNITPNGLLVTFDEYQVAPYAAGPQAVTIPYAQLKDIIREDGPLSGLLDQ